MINSPPHFSSISPRHLLMGDNGTISPTGKIKDPVDDDDLFEPERIEPRKRAKYTLAADDSCSPLSLLVLGAIFLTLVSLAVSGLVLPHFSSVPNIANEVALGLAGTSSFCALLVGIASTSIDKRGVKNALKRTQNTAKDELHSLEAAEKEKIHKNLKDARVLALNDYNSYSNSLPKSKFLTACAAIGLTLVALSIIFTFTHFPPNSAINSQLVSWLTKGNGLLLFAGILIKVLVMKQSPPQKIQRKHYSYSSLESSNEVYKLFFNANDALNNAESEEDLKILLDELWRRLENHDEKKNDLSERIQIVLKYDKKIKKTKTLIEKSKLDAEIRTQLLGLTDSVEVEIHEIRAIYAILQQKITAFDFARNELLKFDENSSINAEKFRQFFIEYNRIQRLFLHFNNDTEKLRNMLKKLNELYKIAFDVSKASPPGPRKIKETDSDDRKRLFDVPLKTL